jgi:hypothetical protein
VAQDQGFSAGQGETATGVSRRLEYLSDGSIEDGRLEESGQVTSFLDELLSLTMLLTASSLALVGRANMGNGVRFANRERKTIEAKEEEDRSPKKPTGEERQKSEAN